MLICCTAQPGCRARLLFLLFSLCIVFIDNPGSSEKKIPACKWRTTLFLASTLTCFNNSVNDGIPTNVQELTSNSVSQLFSRSYWWIWALLRALSEIQQVVSLLNQMVRRIRRKASHKLPQLLRTVMIKFNILLPTTPRSSYFKEKDAILFFFSAQRRGFENVRIG